MSLVEQLAPEAHVIPETIVRDMRRGKNPAPVFVAMLALVVGLTPVMMYANLRFGVGLALGALVAIVLLVLTARIPIFGFYALVFAAVVIEQNRLTTPIGTDTLDVYSWPARFQGLPERPIGFYILAILLLIIAIGLATRRAAILRGGALIIPFLLFLGCVVMGVIHGLATGGDFRIIVLEIRPFWYLFATYLIAYNLVSEKRHVMGFLWILVLGTFFKGLQGCYIVFTALHGHINDAANEIMAHEQSYFFVMIPLLILLCILMKRMRALMWVCIASLPFVVIALLANNRRADYLAFVLGAAAVWILAIRINVAWRKQLIVGLLITSVLAGMYIFVFGSINTPISAPANSIISVIQPSTADARDLQSNLYRVFEDADLKYTEAQSPILGYGFGKPFLTPSPLPNIIGLDPYYLYIPHNNILWIWMRLGPLGYLAFWYLFGAAIVRGGVIMKRLRDPDLQFVALFVIGAILMEIPLAYGDYQIYFYRNVFITGLLMGILLRLPAIDAKAAVETATGKARRPTVADLTRLTRPLMRRQLRTMVDSSGVPFSAERQPEREPEREQAPAEAMEDAHDSSDAASSARSASGRRLRARYAADLWRP